MNIRTTHLFPPIPDRRFDWCAVDDDTYDGDGSHPIGYGPTEQQAIDDLIEQLPTEPFPAPAAAIGS